MWLLLLLGGGGGGDGDDGDGDHHDHDHDDTINAAGFMVVVATSSFLPRHPSALFPTGFSLCPVARCHSQSRKNKKKRKKKGKKKEKKPERAGGGSEGPRRAHRDYLPFHTPLMLSRVSLLLRAKWSY